VPSPNSQVAVDEDGRDSPLAEKVKDKYTGVPTTVGAVEDVPASMADGGLLTVIT